MRVTARPGFLRAGLAALVSAALLAALPAAAAAAAAAPPPRVAMILLDTNTSMARTGVSAERAAVQAYLSALPAGVRAGLITFNVGWHLAVAPTFDRGRLEAAVAAVATSGATSSGISGALAGAASEVARLGASAHSRLIVLSDAEELTGRSPTAAIPADVVTWRLDKDDHPATLQGIAAATGGRVAAAGEIAALAAAFRTTATAPSHAAATPAAHPPVASRWPPVLVALLGFVFAALLVIALVGIGSLREIDRSRVLTQQMERYGARHAPASPGGEGKVARTVIAWGTQLLRSSNAEPRLARRLDLAGIARGPAEWAVLGTAVCALLAAGLSVLIGNAVIGVVAGVLAGWLGMRLLLSLRISRRRAAFGEQLPDVLQLVAGSLQAGFSLPQALDAVVREGTQPTAAEFSRALAETRIGIDIGVALDEVAYRMDSDDLRWTVMAIRIQREVGGNLAEILRNTVGTMRERAYLRRHIRALSAEGRLSAYILLALPLLVGTWLFISDGSYMRPLYTTAFGLFMLISGCVLMVAGSVWMRGLIKMEV